MDAQEIIRLLEEPNENRIPVKRHIIDTAPVEELVAAMHESMQPLTRQILCDILGDRKVVQALPDEALWFREIHLVMVACVRRHMSCGEGQPLSGKNEEAGKMSFLFPL